MTKRYSPFDYICDVNNLALAWRQVCGKTTASGISRRSVALFERGLQGHLSDLATSLSEGSYTPYSGHSIGNGREITDEFGMIEDLIAQRVTFNAIAPLVEPEALEAGFGYDSVDDAKAAAKCVLRHRMNGGEYVTVSAIADLDGSVDHDLVMHALAARISDELVLDLIQMWLDCGLLLPRSEWQSQLPFANRFLGKLKSSTIEPMNAAISRLLDLADDFDGEIYEPGGGNEEEMYRSTRNRALKRIGVNTAVCALASAAVMASPYRVKRLFTPTTMAVTGAALMTTVALPRVSRYLRDKFGADSFDFVEVFEVSGIPEFSLSTLLKNLVLFEFDEAMTKNRLALVRLGAEFAIITSDPQSADLVLEIAESELAGLGLRIDRQATYIARFDQKVEAFGHEFHPQRIAARPIPSSAQWHSPLPGLFAGGPKVGRRSTKRGLRGWINNARQLLGII